jgi:hypothetical protein
LDGRAELESIDVSALGYRLQKELDTSLRFSREHAKKAAVQLSQYRLIPGGHFANVPAVDPRTLNGEKLTACMPQIAVLIARPIAHLIKSDQM